MPDKKFELGDYVEVKDRIKLFYELFGQGRLVTADVQLTREPDDVPRVIVKAYAYRSPDDPLPAVGWSWLSLPGATPYTRGSEIENAETSAWGRAIAALGILVDRSIASAQEVENKRDDRKPDPHPDQVDQETGEVLPMEFTGRLSYGTSAPTDGQLRMDPKRGAFFGFKLTSPDGKTKIPQVVAQGSIADILSSERTGHRLDEGTTVTVWGDVERVDWEKDGKKMRPFQRLHIARVQTPEVTLPAPALPKDEAAELDALEVPWPDVVRGDES